MNLYCCTRCFSYIIVYEDVVGQMRLHEDRLLQTGWQIEA